MSSESPKKAELDILEGEFIEIPGEVLSPYPEPELPVTELACQIVIDGDFKLIERGIGLRNWILWYEQTANASVIKIPY